ncbi:methyltransferase family protein [Terracoccus luteus]|uniref:Methyltransferase family protein n=1 Tax=Terracoccus luteus TaxID=53356 RepID=A0A495Y1G0_9MICO|nr:class I SAM-dependent methyltransferase [Terracoccus luteus]RKT78746.1 methyltransferase family protein [Terracoccus luteus]
MGDDGDRQAGVARLFDQLAEVYDQGGVPFFRPIAGRLVALLAPQPGEEALDVGCGRGAVTLRLCDAVAPGGRVVGVDLSAAMVELLRRDASRSGVTDLDLLVGDAADVGLAPSSFDLVTASLVLFFSPDPAATLTQWVSLLKPGGRIGLTTFGGRDAVWSEVDDLFTPHLPPALLDPRTTGVDSPFASTAGLEALVVRCGAATVRSRLERVELTLPDAAAWRAWTMSVGQRAMWAAVPETERESLFAAATTLLERARGGDGLIRLGQDVRYTVASR